MFNASSYAPRTLWTGFFLGATFSCLSSANAQTTTQVATTPAQSTTTTTTSSGPVTREVREEAYMPNRYLLTTGLLLWGVPYLTGVAVAAQSSNSADQHLYVPLVGPWIDLGQRGPCPVGNNECNTETTNKVLLGVDGVLQAVGTLEVFWGFLRPEHREITTVAAIRFTPKIRLTPSRIASGYGLTALAEF